MDECSSNKQTIRTRCLAAAATSLLFMGILPLACSTTSNAFVKREDGSVAARGVLRAGKQDGAWQFFHANGQPESAGSFRNDGRDGLWQHWYADGKQRMAGRYANDRQVGAWKFWYSNGQVSCQGEYRDGREHGQWSFFHDNGQLQQRGCFLDGKRVLGWCAFDRDGRPRAAGVYCADQPIGRWSEPSPDQTPTNVEYPTPAGVRWLHEVWDDGSTRREGLLSDGVAEGLWLTRHRGGAMRCIGTMTGGRPHGEWEAFASDGSLLASGLVSDGRLHGTWSIGDPAGNHLEAMGGRPCPPWNGTWSEASIAQQTDPLLAVEQWLAEVQAPIPRDPLPVAAAAPATAPLHEPTERLEAPTDPGQFTVLERNELQTYRRYYRDGFLPRSDLGIDYGGSAEEGRGLGTGDTSRGRALLGHRLPVTRFRTVAGGELDLDTLRGRKVLLVVLRGFTAQVCVYCFAQTAELAPVTERLAELGCELVVLFPGTKSRFDAFRAACAREFGDSPPPYHLVYDPDLALAKALGIEGNLARPSSLLLDATGVVRFAYVAESVKNVADRPPAQRLLEQVQRLDAK